MSNGIGAPHTDGHPGRRTPTGTRRAAHRRAPGAPHTDGHPGRSRPLARGGAELAGLRGDDFRQGKIRVGHAAG